MRVYESKGVCYVQLATSDMEHLFDYAGGRKSRSNPPKFSIPVSKAEYRAIKSIQEEAERKTTPKKLEVEVSLTGKLKIEVNEIPYVLRKVSKKRRSQR